MAQLAKTLWRATIKFVDDGGSAIASNVALSLLLSLFPFLMLVASLVRVWGNPELIDEIFKLVLEHWPADSEQAISEQIRIMVALQPNEFFSIGTVVALVLATNGIENARDGLNRAYRVVETRPFWWRRLQGAMFVIIGAFGLILAAFILIATPLVWSFLVNKLSWLEPFSFTVRLTKYALAVGVLTITLFCFHRFLPDGKRSIRTTFPGIALTISGIIVGSQLFALYLQTIANYTALYAGLAGTMVAIVYLYGLSALILFGAEFNAALAEDRAAKG